MTYRQFYTADLYAESARSINVRLSDAELAARPMRPLTRKRVVAKSLKAYANMVSSADKGGVRIID